MKLYGYFRSSSAFRVRIALNLKKIKHETDFIKLPAGVQFADEYCAVNPQARVPTLEDGALRLYQSLAIIEYLDETNPQPPLLPSSAEARARIRGIAQIIACDIHPLGNLAVLNYLNDPLGVDAEAKEKWFLHWIYKGFVAVERLLAEGGETGRFCHGDSPGLADICLVPQVFNARRFDCDLDPYPTITAIFDNCMVLEAFDRAQPSRQPDAA